MVLIYTAVLLWSAISYCICLSLRFPNMERPFSLPHAAFLLLTILYGWRHVLTMLLGHLQVMKNFWICIYRKPMF